MTLLWIGAAHWTLWQHTQEQAEGSRTTDLLDLSQALSSHVQDGDESS